MNAITNPAPIGDNSGAAPLSELLGEETAALKKRADDLVAAASRAAVTDDDTAGKATLLAKMIADHRKDIEAARESRKEPFLRDGRIVDAYFGAIDKLLAEVDGKKKVIGGPLARVIGLVDAYRRKKDDEAAAARLKLQQEAQRLRDEAAAAAALANQVAGQTEASPEARLDMEIKARQIDEQAEALQQKAASISAGPIDSGFGAKAGSRKVFTAEITDLTAALKHCRKVDEASIKAAVQQVYDRQVRAGVRELPGATVHETSATVIR